MPGLKREFLLLSTFFFCGKDDTENQWVEAGGDGFSEAAFGTWQVITWSDVIF